jgi:prevent-host-death family protein
VKTINIHEAKTHLSKLVERVEAGEEFVIARAGRPAARLVPLERIGRPITRGNLKLDVPDDFNTMFEAEIEALFTGQPAARKKRSTQK